MRTTRSKPLQHQTLRAPQGFATLPDPAALREDRCRLLTGFLPARAGEMRPVLVPKLLYDNAADIDGLAFYSRGLTGYDRLLLSSGTSLYASALTYADGDFEGRRTGALTLGALQLLTSSFDALTLPWFRYAQHRDELIFFRANSTGGVNPWRFYVDASNVDHLAICGLQPPSALGTLGSTGTGLTGIYTYVQTWVDERGRESSPCASGSITVTNKTITIAKPSGTTGGDTGIVYWRTYRRNPGGSVYYRIATTAVATASINDSAADSSIVANPLSPAAGQYDPPNSPSIICVWKDRVVLNDAANPQGIQISNAGSATQFASFSTATVGTDGLRLTVGTLPSDDVTGLIAAGSPLGVFSRYGFTLVVGDTAADFQQHPVHTVGCVAPDSVQATARGVYYMSANGVQRMAGGYVPTEIGAEVQDAWRGMQFAGPRADHVVPTDFSVEAGQLQISRAWVHNDRYYITTGMRTLVYDEIAGGWADSGYGRVCRAAVGQVGTGAPRFMAFCPVDDIAEVGQRIYYAIEGVPYRATGSPYLEWPVAGDLQSRPFDGAGLARSRTKLLKRLRIWGEYVGEKQPGTPIGTVTLDADGYQETYPLKVPTAWVASDSLLVLQDPSPAMRGRLLSVILHLDDTQVVIRDLMMEYEPQVGGQT